MAKRPVKKKPARDHQQVARAILDAVDPTAEPPKKKTKQDKLDEARAVDEGMGQPQDQGPPAKNPAAVALGKLGGLKGGNARKKKLSKKRMVEIAKQGAEARWAKKRKKDADDGRS